MVALASAFVRLRPQADKAEFVRSGTEMGSAAGKGYADGFYRDSNGKLRQANGKFATDAQKQAAEGGRKAGAGFAGGFGKESSKLGGIIKQNLKLGAGLFVPLGIGAAVGQIAKIGIAYEDNLNILQAVTKATGAQMAQVSAKARQLGADVTLPGVSAAGAAEAMTELAKSGLSVAQAMDAAKGTLQLARAAGIGEAKAAEITGNAINAFGLKAKDTTFVVDQLASAANSSSVEMGDVSDAFQMAAAVFSGFQSKAAGSKGAITELNTAIAILGNNGIKGSDAGTSLKQMLLQLTGPSQRAKNAMAGIAYEAANAAGGMNELLLPSKVRGGKIEQVDTGMTLLQATMRGSVKASGEALSQLAKLNPSLNNIGDIAYTSSGKMRPLRDTLDLLTKGLKDETEENRNAALTQIFGADATRSVIALMKGGLPVYDAMQKAVLQSGAAADVARAKNKGLGGAIDNLKSQFENMAISIYNGVKGPLTAALNGLASTLSGVADGISGAFGSMARHAGAIRGVAIALGILVTAMAEYKAVTYLVVAAQKAFAAAMFLINFVRLAAQLRSVSAAMAALDIAMDANPIGLVVVGLTALVAGLIYAYKHSEAFRRIVTGAWASIRATVAPVVSWITGTAVPFLVKAWNSIAAAVVQMWTKYVQPALSALRGYIAKNVTPTVLSLWQNVVKPAFTAIGAIIAAMWAIVKPILQLLWATIKNVLIPVLLFLLRNVVVPVFKQMASTVGIAVKVVLAVLAGFLAFLRNVVFPGIRILLTVVTSVFRGIASFIRSTVAAVLGVFHGLATFITKTLPNAFATGVAGIRRVWNDLRTAASVPVRFVVDHVINPFIGGINKVAGAVGLSARIPAIRFAEGGSVPLGYARGGRIAGMPAATDNRQAMVAGLGPVQLMGGEFVVNARDTAKALPLLRWINSGMKQGNVAQRIGRPLADQPGDGSQGWAFAGGGLVGFVKDAWGALSNPTALIRKPFEAALRSIPGAGLVKDMVVGMAKKVLGGAVDWLSNGAGLSGLGAAATSAAVGGGRLGAAMTFLRGQAGKPYVWASAGPGGYDCSGIVSAAYNILKGRNPYSHTFSTGSLPGPWFREGQRTGALVAGWSNPGQAPASNSTGHMAGQLGAMPFESRGSRGVIVGSGARRVTQFAHIGAARFADGGQVPIRLFDKGGMWPSGTLGANLSGHTEYVDPSGRSGGGDIHFHFHGPVSSEQAAEDLVVKGYNAAKRKRRIS